MRIILLASLSKIASTPKDNFGLGFGRRARAARACRFR